MSNNTIPNPPLSNQLTYGNSPFISQSWGLWITRLWTKLGSTANLGSFYIPVEISDIHTAGQFYLPVPATATINGFMVCVQGTITGANEVIDIKNSSGNILGTLSIPNGSVAGSVVQTVINQNNNVNQFSNMSLNFHGLSSSPVGAVFIIALAY